MDVKKDISAFTFVCVTLKLGDSARASGRLMGLISRFYLVLCTRDSNCCRETAFLMAAVCEMKI